MKQNKTTMRQQVDSNVEVQNKQEENELLKYCNMKIEIAGEEKQKLEEEMKLEAVNLMDWVISGIFRNKLVREKENITVTLVVIEGSEYECIGRESTIKCMEGFWKYKDYTSSKSTSELFAVMHYIKRCLCVKENAHITDMQVCEETVEEKDNESKKQYCAKKKLLYSGEISLKLWDLPPVFLKL